MEKLRPLLHDGQASLSELALGEDVLRERDRAYSVEPDEDHPIVLRDLKKEFPPQDGNPKKVAVANMSLAIARGECFGCDAILLHFPLIAIHSCSVKVLLLLCVAQCPWMQLHRMMCRTLRNLPVLSARAPPTTPPP